MDIGILKVRMPTMDLLFADIVRDGGTLEAAFVTDAGVLGLDLRIARDVSGPERSYGALYLTRPGEGQVVVEKKSDLEAEIYAALDDWLAKPTYSDAWGSAEVRRPNMLERLKDLRDQAARRLG